MLYKSGAFENNPTPNQSTFSICGTLRLHYFVRVFSEAFFRLANLPTLPNEVAKSQNKYHLLHDSVALHGHHAQAWGCYCALMPFYKPYNVNLTPNFRHSQIIILGPYFFCYKFIFVPFEVLLLCNVLLTHSIVEDCMYLLPPANEVWGKVMFSQVFVCPGGLCPSMHHRSHDQGGLCPGVSVRETPQAVIPVR